MLYTQIYLIHSASVSSEVCVSGERCLPIELVFVAFAKGPDLLITIILCMVGA